MGSMVLSTISSHSKQLSILLISYSLICLYFIWPFVRYYSPHDRVEAVQSCTPKAVVSSKDDVVHNAKIYYERLVNKILDDAGKLYPILPFPSSLH